MTKTRFSMKLTLSTAFDALSFLLVGRDMVEYLEHGLSYHVAQELKCQDDASMATRLERAFLMADIHSRQMGVTMSGSTVAICLVQVRLPIR